MEELAKLEAERGTPGYISAGEAAANGGTEAIGRRCLLATPDNHF